MLAVTEGLGICWSECSWSRVNPTWYTIAKQYNTSSKVHGAQGVLVDLDRLGQCLVVSPVALPRGMASFSAAETREEEGKDADFHGYQARHWDQTRGRKAIIMAHEKPGSCPNPLPGTTLTCHVLYPPGGTWLGRPPGEHSKLGQGSTQSVCSARRCDTAGRSESAAHRKKNDCHPKARGSGKDGLSPEREGQKDSA